MVQTRQFKEKCEVTLALAYRTFLAIFEQL